MINTSINDYPRQDVRLSQQRVPAINSTNGKGISSILYVVKLVAAGVAVASATRKIMLRLVQVVRVEVGVVRFNGFGSCTGTLCQE